MKLRKFIVVFIFEDDIQVFFHLDIILLVDWTFRQISSTPKYNLLINSKQQLKIVASLCKIIEYPEGVIDFSIRQKTNWSILLYIEKNTKKSSLLCPCKVHFIEFFLFGVVDRVWGHAAYQLC